MNEQQRLDAAEYVLGTLDTDARVALERALLTDRKLAREVYDWQDRLLPLLDRVAPSEPSNQLWPRIAQRLPAPPDAPRWWQKLLLWQGLSAAALVLSVGLALQLARSPAPAEVRYVAILQPRRSRLAGWSNWSTPILYGCARWVTCRYWRRGAPGNSGPSRSTRIGPPRYVWCRPMVNCWCRVRRCLHSARNSCLK